MSSIVKPIILDETGKEIVEVLDEIRSAIEGSETNQIYGVRRSLTSTSTAWVRTDSASNLEAHATKDGSEVVNDFDDIYPWSDIITVNFDTTENKVVATYGDSNFAFDGSNGEVLTYIPEFYLKRWQTTDKECVQIAKHKFDGAVKVEPFYIGRYTTSSGTHSYSGVASTVSQTRATFRTQAKAKGTKWSQLDILHYSIIEMLYLVEYANADSQSMLGQGVCSVSAQVNTGGCDSLGMKSGCLANAGATSMIYRGVENFYGNIWQFVDGVNVTNNQAWVCYTSDNYADDTFAYPYVQLGYVNASSNGNPNKMGYDSSNPLIGLPTAVGTSTYGDYYYQNSGNRIALVGGGWGNGSGVGCFCWYLPDASGNAASSIGGRLLRVIS